MGLLSFKENPPDHPNDSAFKIESIKRSRQIRNLSEFDLTKIYDINTDPDLINILNTITAKKSDFFDIIRDLYKKCYSVPTPNGDQILFPELFDKLMEIIHSHEAKFKKYTITQQILQILQSVAITSSNPENPLFALPIHEILFEIIDLCKDDDVTIYVLDTFTAIFTNPILGADKLEFTIENSKYIESIFHQYEAVSSFIVKEKLINLFSLAIHSQIARETLPTNLEFFSSALLAIIKSGNVPDYGDLFDLVFALCLNDTVMLFYCTDKELITIVNEQLKYGLNKASISAMALANKFCDHNNDLCEVFFTREVLEKTRSLIYNVETDSDMITISRCLEYYRTNQNQMFLDVFLFPIARYFKNLQHRAIRHLIVFFGQHLDEFLKSDVADEYKTAVFSQIIDEIFELPQEQTITMLLSLCTQYDSMKLFVNQAFVENEFEESLVSNLTSENEEISSLCQILLDKMHSDS